MTLSAEFLILSLVVAFLFLSSFLLFFLLFLSSSFTDSVIIDDAQQYIMFNAAKANSVASVHYSMHKTVAIVLRSARV